MTQSCQTAVRRALTMNVPVAHGTYEKSVCLSAVSLVDGPFKYLQHGHIGNVNIMV